MLPFNFEGALAVLRKPPDAAVPTLGNTRSKSRQAGAWNSFAKAAGKVTGTNAAAEHPLTIASVIQGIEAHSVTYRATANKCRKPLTVVASE